MNDAPTITDSEPILDLDAVDTDIELVEPTAIESTPVPESAPITPSTQADAIAAAITQWLADIERLPGLTDRLADIQDATRVAYAEYSAGLTTVNRRLAETMRPLDIERRELESQVSAGESAKKRLDELAGVIQGPTTTPTIHTKG